MYLHLMTTAHSCLSALIQKTVRDEKGQDLAEYALLLVFIAVACIVGVTALGDRILAIFNDLAGSI